MKVAIRVDASLKIGTGHVMRCLTLAEALKQQGGEVEFICREHKGHLIERIKQQGFNVHKLALDSQINDLKEQEGSKRERLYGAHWLGSTQQQDAEQCKALLEKIQADWLIVDHYSLDQTWQMLLKQHYKKLMVIDDLADRKHQCDLLLDQTYGRNKDDYSHLVPEYCQMLLGSHYALLRPEFAEWRDYSIKRRTKPELKKLLITMGGVDPDNITGQVLEALKTCQLPEELSITVVLGETAPNINAVKVQVAEMPYKVQIKTNVNNMAELMANSDLAIGAAGATTWERCCLGLPSMMMVLADNQKFAAMKIKESGAVLILDSTSDLFDAIKGANLSLLMQKSSSLCEGIGVKKILEYIL